MSHLLIWGNAYVQIIRDRSGNVISLYPLLPDKMSVHRDSRGILYYKYQRQTEENPNITETGTVVLPQEDVLHVRGLGFDGFDRLFSDCTCEKCNRYDTCDRRVWSIVFS